MYGVADKYVRLQEYPFSSEQKMMAVKCVPKYGEVSLVNNSMELKYLLAYFIINKNFYRTKKKFIL